MEIILNYIAHYHSQNLSFSLYSVHNLELESGKLLIPAFVGNTRNIVGDIYKTSMVIKSIDSDLRIDVVQKSVNYQGNRIICFIDANANVIDLEGNIKNLDGLECLALFSDGLFWVNGQLLECSITYDFNLKSICCATENNKQYIIGFQDLLLLTKKREIAALRVIHDAFRFSELYINYRELYYLDYENHTQLVDLSMFINRLSTKYGDILHILKHEYISKLLEFTDLKIKHCIQIKTNKCVYNVYPVYFAYILNENNGLYYYNRFKNESCIDLLMFCDTVVKLLLVLIHSNKFPTLDQLLSTNIFQEDIVTQLYKLCDYIDIKIYKNYFCEIKDSQEYQNLFHVELTESMDLIDQFGKSLDKPIKSDPMNQNLFIN